MSDSPLSDDELISSYLDNEVTSDERALVESRLAAEPAFAARVRELQGAANLAATPVAPLSAAATDDLIAAALAASTTTAANVTDLAAAGASRGRSAWKGKLVAAAAVAAALVIAIPLVNNLADDDNENFATSADAAGDSADDGADDGFAADTMVEELGDADTAGEAEASAAYAEGDDMAYDGDDMGDDMADDMDDAMADDMGDEGTAAVEEAVDDGAEPTTTTGAGSLTTARARLSAALTVDDDSDADTFFRVEPAVADFATSNDALAAAEQQWTAFIDLGRTTGSVPPASLNGADLDQLDDLARERLDELGACATLLDRLRDHVLQLPGPPLVDDTDLARISVGGRPATLVVLAFNNGTAEAVLVPDDICVVEASRSLG